MTAKKTTAKTTAVRKRAQPHGGALNVGGTQGNKGGTGRPPSAIRATARLLFDQRLPILDSIAGNKKAKHTDRIRAVEVLGKVGMEQAISIADVRAALELTGAEIRGMLPAEQAEQLITRIRVHWMRL